MKLIVEQVENVKVITEAKENGKKNMFIEGIFLQADLQNRNGRIYPVAILEKEVNRYVTENIEKKRAYGELGHPQGPSINLDRVSHMIESIRKDGPNFIGRAKVLETPMGNIVRNLIDEGANLGVSSRGMGSIKESKNGIMEVQSDFYLATAADIVADPSAPDAFVQGIMEGVEWVWNNGALKQVHLEAIKRDINRASASHSLDESTKLKMFERFLNSISSN